jgi:hypothetical protein
MRLYYVAPPIAALYQREPLDDFIALFFDEKLDFSIR